LDRIERIFAQTNRVVVGLARSGLSLRSDVRELQKFRARSERFQARTDENLVEIPDKLDALIDVVGESLRRNGGGRWGGAVTKEREGRTPG
jgi:hypothetical protein